MELLSATENHRNNLRPQNCCIQITRFNLLSLLRTAHVTSHFVFVVQSHTTMPQEEPLGHGDTRSLDGEIATLGDVGCRGESMELWPVCRGGHTANHSAGLRIDARTLFIGQGFTGLGVPTLPFLFALTPRSL